MQPKSRLWINIDHSRSLEITESVNRWCVAGEKIKRTCLMVSLKCQQSERRWAAFRQSILNWIKHYWTGFQRSQGKSFVSLKQWKASISWYLSDRVAMFTQTVGMTASDWPVFHVVKFRILLSTRKFFLAKYPAISRTPYLGENLPVLSLICWKNRSAYRRINTVML